MLVAAELAEGLAAQSLPRRDAVVVVGTDLDDATVWERAVRLGAQHVVFLPEGVPWLIDRLAAAEERDARRGRCIAVVGGRGGAGASTLAVALGLAASRRALRAVLVDLDPMGAGLDLLLGAEDRPGLRWPDLAGTRGRLAADALESALPMGEGVAVLAASRQQATRLEPGVLTTVLDAVVRGYDLCVLDLPRALDPPVAEAAARCEAVWLLVPAEVTATASARAVARSLREAEAPVRLVVRGPAPGGLPAQIVADALGMPLDASVRGEPGLAAALDRGEVPGRASRSPLARLADRLLDELGVDGRRDAA